MTQDGEEWECEKWGKVREVGGDAESDKLPLFTCLCALCVESSAHFVSRVTTGKDARERAPRKEDIGRKDRSLMVYNTLMLCSDS
mmetsp:Transcript_18620/g.52418  ORF Transcript_18620/g.52418 Transcript_18620/m.52418 type:complete len:85 (+) Transcript_18620:187-441(+)